MLRGDAAIDLFLDERALMQRLLRFRENVVICRLTLTRS